MFVVSVGQWGLDRLAVHLQLQKSIMQWNYRTQGHKIWLHMDFSYVLLSC